MYIFVSEILLITKVEITAIKIETDVLKTVIIKVTFFNTLLERGNGILPDEFE
jgi:hypothetical protein